MTKLTQKLQRNQSNQLMNQGFLILGSRENSKFEVTDSHFAKILIINALWMTYKEKNHDNKINYNHDIKGNNLFTWSNQLEFFKNIFFVKERVYV